MSTTLKNLKSTLTFVKTSVSRALSEGQEDGIYTKMLTDAGILNPEGKQSATELEAKLFEQIVTQNINDFNATYESRYADESEAYRVQADQSLKNIAKLNSLTLPDNHVTDGMICALASDVLNGLDSATELEKAISQFSDSMKVKAVTSQPECINADVSTIQNAALAVTSMRSWGDMQLEMSRGMSMVMEQLSTWGTYTESGNHRDYYPEQVLAGYLKCMYNDDFSSLLYTGKQDDFGLPDVVSLTERVFRIASDIPKATEQDKFAVAKLFSELESYISTDIWAEKAKAIHADLDDAGIARMRKDVSTMNSRYCSMVSQNLLGYKRYYSQGVEKEVSNSL